MIRWVAVARLTSDNERMLIVQRVHIFVPGTIESRQFELLATPAVHQAYPDGIIIGWFDTWQELTNNSQIEVELEPTNAV